MKLFIILFILSTSLCLKAEVLSCSKKKIVLTGQYGKNQSPLLKLWSETAGNFTRLEVSSKVNVPQVQFVLMDEQGKELKTNTLALKNNSSQKFNFNKMVNEAVIRPNTLTIKLFDSKGESICMETMNVVEIDGPGGVSKKL